MNAPALHPCPHCGADCEVGKRVAGCAMANWPATRLSTPSWSKKAPPHAPSDAFFAVVSGFLAVVVLLVGVGTAFTQPGLAIALAIVVAPALVATLVRTQKQQQRHGYVSWGERLATFVVSAAMVVGVLSALGAAAMIALVAFCFYALATGQF